MKTTTKVFIAVGIVFFIGHVVKPAVAPSTADKVKAVCQTQSVDECHEAERQTGLNFICDGLEAESHCMVVSEKANYYSQR